ncbi:right-handed parallel beta-helix repeat-containing protein [Streptomyces sp. NPDC059740]|uniref:right-handed parallel beta-helix repeat-containing protein n=1 Tax=Streptomyces sp. NPDC059740 TaxID=3346926 RepID=UPI003652B83B
MTHRARSLLALAAVLAAALLTPAPAATAAPAPLVLHAAPHGSGDHCEAARPCSLTGARDAARAALAADADRGVRVELRGGTYRMTAPLALGPRDSGTPAHPVTWTAAPGARPVLSGGQVLDHWTPRADGTWTTHVPDGTTARQLFVGGRRAVPARGEACPAAVCDATASGMSGARATGIDHWAHPTDAEAVIKVRWRNYHCRIAGVHGDTLTFVQPCWANSSSGTGRTGPAWDTTTVDSSRYDGVAWFQNARELLDEPGEFSFESGTGTLTYLPLPGQDMRHTTALTPATEHLLTLDGAHDLRISGTGLAYAAYRQPSTTQGYAGTQAGLTLTGTTGPVDHAGRHYTKPAAALTVRGGSRVTVDHAAFSHLGGAGAVLEAGTKDTAVTDSTFTDLSSGALYVGDTEPDPAPELAGQRNTVARNTITHTGVEYSDAVGIWAGYEAGLRVDHNTLTDLPYSGISVGWGWNQPEARQSVLRDNRITANRITDAMQADAAQHDGGGIYTQGAQPGTVISGNYVDRVGYGSAQHDGNGVYLDEQSSYIRVEANVITRVPGKYISNWADYGIQNTGTGNWTDSDAPAPAGAGSSLHDHTRLTELPAAAVAVAARAGAHGGPVDQLATDWARTATATQATTAGTATADLAVDGDNNTWTATGAGPGAWWQLDLGTVRRVGTVELWNDGSAATADVDLALATRPDMADATVHHLDGTLRSPTELTGLHTRARYLRVTATGSGRVGLATVRVHP